jgi:magnesium chelatase subunit H
MAVEGEGPTRVVLVTLDNHLAGAWREARSALVRELPGLDLRLHVAADWGSDPGAAERCRQDLEAAHLVFVSQIFLEEHIRVLLPVLTEHRERYDALVCILSAGEIVRLTRMGRFSMGGPKPAVEDGEEAPKKGAWSPMALLKRLKGEGKGGRSSGRRQMLVLKGLPKLLRFIPGPAQDVRAYFLTLQYWFAGSAENIGGLVRFLLSRYAAPGRLAAGRVAAKAPVEYPETGVYHPAIRGHRMSTELLHLPRRPDARGRVGVVLMRSYLLAGNTKHYDAVLSALEARDLEVVPVFASGLDARPAIERFLVDASGRPRVDALVSLTGFSLVGGPAYSDAEGARRVLASLDIPYLAVQPLEFQTVAEWEGDSRGLNPLQSALMVALPELDGATGPLVFSGRGGDGGATRTPAVRASTTPSGEESLPILDRVDRLAGRVARWIALRRTPRKDRKVAVVLFNFPPNGGNVGTAAYLDVFTSLHRTLQRMAEAGYAVEVPATPEDLRSRIVEGNRDRFGAPAHVHHRIPADDHVRRDPHLREIEAQWGPAPGRNLSDGRHLFVLGERFGNVFVGVQPPFGYEGDPMRLLFEGGCAPTHAFSAFYRWIREDFGAHAALHFGTHGALEFMPGKHVGLSSRCWPDRLIGDLPNVYLYASNNSSEGTLAKRRSAATLVSYLTPPVGQAGLYRGLAELRGLLDRARQADPASGEWEGLVEALQAKGAELELTAAGPAWTRAGAPARMDALREKLLEVEYALIPYGLHTLGAPPPVEARVELVLAMSQAGRSDLGMPSLREAFGMEGEGNEAENAGLADRVRPVLAGLVEGRAGVESTVLALVEMGSAAPEARPLVDEWVRLDGLLEDNRELDAVVHALDGGYIPPAPGGDLLRNPGVLPTGRNLYGFDPWRVPSSFAVADGRRQAERLLERHSAEGNDLPETVALVLWANDNLKTEGAAIAQALALMGALPRFDSYGRLTGAELIPLETLGRPRIDVILTVSGIFRDLLPLQMKLLAEAAWLASTADEPVEMNFIRKHTAAHCGALGVDLETAALRVFSNQDGAYGANVNNLVESGAWVNESELAEAFVKRKGFAYGRDATGKAQPELMRRALGGADLTYQVLDSVELGVSDVDQYVDSLGGLARTAALEQGRDVPVYLGDQTRGEGKVRTLSEQVELEARTRMLNPRWYEAMLKHGYQGVRELDVRVTTTLGWSATTGKVAPWVYQQVGETFVLDETMRRRLAALNPGAAARMAGRLLEATDRGYWSPDDETLDALRRAADELEDTLEGVEPEVAA